MRHLSDALARLVVSFALTALFVGVCFAAAGIIILIVHLIAPTGVAR